MKGNTYLISSHAFRLSMWFKTVNSRDYFIINILDQNILHTFISNSITHRNSCRLFCCSWFPFPLILHAYQPVSVDIKRMNCFSCTCGIFEIVIVSVHSSGNSCFPARMYIRNVHPARMYIHKVNVMTC